MVTMSDEAADDYGRVTAPARVWLTAEPSPYGLLLEVFLPCAILAISLLD